MAGLSDSAPQSDAEIRLKRLRIRSWRRGTREMDMLLGPFADAALPTLDAATLDAFEALLEVGDNELYAWISGARPEEAAHAPILARIRAFHGVAL
jgi:antitoxin CptB